MYKQSNDLNEEHGPGMLDRRQFSSRWDGRHRSGVAGERRITSGEDINGDHSD